MCLAAGRARRSAFHSRSGDVFFRWRKVGGRSLDLVFAHEVWVALKAAQVSGCFIEFAMGGTGRLAGAARRRPLTQDQFQPESTKTAAKANWTTRSLTLWTSREPTRTPG